MAQVKQAALECMTAICNCTGNKDLEPFLPAVVDAASSIDKTHNCVEKLAGCIFEQNVEAPALAVTIPVLTRGLNDKNEEVKRTCCQIVDNMCKLVEDPAEVLPLMLGFAESMMFVDVPHWYHQKWGMGIVTVAV